MTADAPLVSSLEASDTDRILEAQQDVRDYCGWHIAPERQETITVDGTATRVLMLPSMHVTDVSEVTDDGNVVDPSYYTWRDYGVIELHTGCWSDRKVEVTLTHGYPQVPGNVAKVIRRVASRAGSDPGAAQQVGQVRFAVSLTKGAALGGTLSDYDRDDLTPYKIPSRP